MKPKAIHKGLLAVVIVVAFVLLSPYFGLSIFGTPSTQPEDDVDRTLSGLLNESE